MNKQKKFLKIFFVLKVVNFKNFAICARTLFLKVCLACLELF